MEEVITHNKLIAEFMGLPTEVFKSGKVNYYFREFNSGSWYEEHELSYNVSWDWLMPVINKIRSMDSTYEIEEVGKYDWDNLEDIFPKEYYEEISHYEFDLELTYESVVEFINQLNNNNERH
jgi:hypothetical protein